MGTLLTTASHRISSPAGGLATTAASSLIPLTPRRKSILPVASSLPSPRSGPHHCFGGFSIQSQRNTPLRHAYTYATIDVAMKNMMRARKSEASGLRGSSFANVTAHG